MIPHLSDDRLIEHTKSLFAEERRLDLEVLRHLYEIERRKLFLEWGFPSLFEMCVQEFKLSHGSAQRRISAMRLLKEIPEVAPKIQTGELSVSVIAQAQSFLRAEKKQDRPYSKQEKLELVKSFENKSARDVEKELAAKNPAIAQYEVMKPVSATQSRLTLILDNDTKAMLDQIRDLISNANPDMTYEGVITRAAKLLLQTELKKIQPLERTSKKATAKTPQTSQQPPTSTPFPPELVHTSEVDSDIEAQNKNLCSNTDSEPHSPLEHQAKIIPKMKSPVQDRVKIAPKIQSTPQAKAQPTSATSDLAQIELDLTSTAGETLQKNPRDKRRPSAQLKRLVWQRDRARCTYVDPTTHRQCGATAFLQHDHIQPWALGGGTSAENLRLLCGAHNRARSPA